MMWQTQTTIEYPFALRPASIEEAGLFYSQMDEAEDAVLGTVGHIRMDFGASGKEFYEAEHARERKIQKTMLRIKKKFGKNAILKGMNLEDGATARERNQTIGGHQA